MIEFTVGSATYRTDRKIDVFRQNNIVRRLLPALGGIGSALASTAPAADAKAFAAAAGEQFFANLGPITQAIAGMSDADSDYVMQACLGVVSRQQPGGTGWARVMPSPGTMMFEDIGLADLYQIVWKVIEENLAGFFSSIGQILPQPDQDPPASAG